MRAGRLAGADAGRADWQDRWQSWAHTIRGGDAPSPQPPPHRQTHRADALVLSADYPAGRVVLDPFTGSRIHGARRGAGGASGSVGIELDEAYAEVARLRVQEACP